MFSKTVSPSSPAVEIHTDQLPQPNVPGWKFRQENTAQSTEAVQPKVKQKKNGNNKTLPNCLTVKFIREVVDILMKQYPDCEIRIQGIETEHSESRSNTQRKLIANVHIYKGHATLSVRFEGTLVYYIDSQAPEGRERIKNIVELQQQLHDAYQDRFDLRFLYVQQQKPESTDCVVFVIAFLVQILHDKKIDCLEEIIFEYDKMRPHLSKCYENKDFIPFPQEKV